MKTERGVLLLIWFLLVVLAACWRSRDTEPADRDDDGISENGPAVPSSTPSYPPSTALHSGQEYECTPDGGCRLVRSVCDGSWAPGPLPEPRWVRDPPRECLRGVTHELLEYYDDCRGNELPAVECGGGVGSAYCGGARVTTFCLTSSDCPANMLCVDPGYSGEFVPLPNDYPFGQCEKTCNPDGDRLECVRCDFACNPGGFCQPDNSPMEPWSEHR